MGAQFRVEAIFEITGRGGVLAGSIESGSLRAGMCTQVLPLESSPARLVISAVEFADDLRTRRSRVALLFQEKPSADTLRRACPLGSMLVLEHGGAAANSR